MSEQVNVVELSPIQASTLFWRPHRGGPVLTVICKATYELKPGIAPLAASADEVNERDLHSENNQKKGLYSASDLAPFKRFADVTLVGKAFAPKGELSRSLKARLRVGTIDKQVEVHAERYFGPDGVFHDEAFFSKMPIGYERSAGGTNTVNPVGRSLKAPANADGRVLAPNLVKPGEAISSPDSALTPVGFGPIPGNWPSRQQRVHAESAAWLSADWSTQKAPAQFDWNYFNVAPDDQRLRELAADEVIELEHLHPEEPKLVTRLPGVEPCVFVHIAGQGRMLQMKADTLWIDTNRMVLTLCWRGQQEVNDVTQPTQVVVAMAQAGERLSWAQVEQRLNEQRARDAVAPSSPRVDALNTQVKINRKPVVAARMTSPVPLVPSTNHSPAWLPPPSSDSPATLAATGSQPGGTVPASAPPSSGSASTMAPPSPGRGSGPGEQQLQLYLNHEDAFRAQKLAAALHCDVDDALRQALRDAFQARFGRG